MPLQFIFAKDSFVPDMNSETLPESEAKLRERFISDRYKTLFDIGSETAAAGESMSLGFLRTVSERFIKMLTSMPELELVRENAKAVLSEEVCDELLDDVPFGIGTEYIDREWFSGIFEKLNEVFHREMSAYSGTVQMFFTEKGQQLRVPERIFFHLCFASTE